MQQMWNAAVKWGESSQRGRQKQYNAKKLMLVHSHWKQAGIVLYPEEDILLYHNNANNKIV